jgi:fibronectin-binding autotransporter adhesin
MAFPLALFFAPEGVMSRSSAAWYSALARLISLGFGLLAAMVLAGPVQSARAGFAPDGDVSPSDPSTWDYYTDGYIGKTANGTLTVDGGYLYSAAGYIGYESTAAGVVNISGTGSGWTNRGLYVGDSGSGTLSIIGGGYLRSRYYGQHYSNIGYAAGSTGVLTVAGTGSTWVNECDLYVGTSGSGTLSIASGGSVSNIVCPRYGYLGYNSGSSGLVAVDGAGSTWNVSMLECLYVGYNGSGMLSITNGGSVSGDNRVPDTYARIGYRAGSSGTVTVDGAGSTWNVDGNLYAGTSGAATLRITNGGSVSHLGEAQFGPLATIDFGTNGGTLTTDSLFASPSQMAGTGTIVTRGLISDFDLRFDSSHSKVQTILLQQPGQKVTLNLDASGKAGTLGAGWKDHGSLTIQDGLALSSYDGYLGCGSGSTGEATVSGSGSTWKIDLSFYVGNAGSGTLSIASGGSVSCGRNASFVGYAPGSQGVVTVDGAGSAWSNGSSLVVGRWGNGTLSITNGGSATSTSGDIGYYSGSTGVVTIDGAGSVWSCSSSVVVGFNGTGTLSITNGGNVGSSSSTIGHATGATGTVAVDGAGSTWISSSNLYVGSSGSGTLSITNGGSVSAVNGTTYVGKEPGSAGMINFGANGGTLTTRLLCASPTQLAGTGTIVARGLISDVNLVFDSAHGLKQAVAVQRSGLNVTVNLDLATDPATNGSLGAGWKGAGSLTIQDGIVVQSPDSFLGYSQGSVGVATVSGNGSTWICGGLNVGSYGSGALLITGGGSVTGYGGWIGRYAGSSGMVTVNGIGSAWTITNGSYSTNVCVGDGGSGALSITGGAAVRNAADNSNCFVGDSAGSVGMVSVDGAGSIWANGGAIFVGYYGAGTVAQTGGSVSAGRGLYLGACSTGNGAYSLNGGTLTINLLEKGGGTAAFNFGGGTLQASDTFSSDVPMNLTGSSGNANVNTNGFGVTLSGILSGNGGLKKSGDGMLTLSAANSYRDRTTVAAGTVRLGSAAQDCVLNLGGADIQTGMLVFDYAGETSPAATVLGLLTDSYHDGLWDVGQFRHSRPIGAGLTLGWLDDPAMQTVTVMATYPGDFNLDGVADAQDMDIMVAHLGRHGTWSSGDANYDGLVDLLDWNLWKASLGLPPLESPGAVAVPEPGTLLMLALGLVSLLACVCRRRPRPFAGD